MNEWKDAKLTQVRLKSMPWTYKDTRYAGTWKELSDKMGEVDVSDTKGPEYQPAPGDVRCRDKKLMAEAEENGRKFREKIAEMRRVLKKRYKKRQPDKEGVHGDPGGLYPGFPHMLDIKHTGILMAGGGKYLTVHCGWSYTVRVQSERYVTFHSTDLNEVTEFIDNYMYGYTW